MILIQETYISLEDQGYIKSVSYYESNYFSTFYDSSSKYKLDEISFLGSSGLPDDFETMLHQRIRNKLTSDELYHYKVNFGTIEKEFLLGDLSLVMYL